eukprot:snap_masked-scaffold859_size87536-processed-gene-0.0 protein:Tk11607 transcript:snap_masked-scaffold859_size87536-processed-gene-0.0-mRNA-1 annotation:"hypothetical protein DFA_03248"
MGYFACSAKLDYSREAGKLAFFQQVMAGFVVGRPNYSLGDDLGVSTLLAKLSVISHDAESGSELVKVLADLFYHPGPGENASFAYVWYISQPHYLCSALVSLKRLKSMRSKTSFPYPVDYVMVYTAEDPLDSPSDHLVKKWEAEGGKRVEFPSLKKHIANAYYRTSLQKFYAFQLIQYSRVVAMDADGVALNNLDHLFLLKFPENVSIAAPQGYWFQNEGVFAGNGDNCKGVVFPVITTILLVVEPSLELFQRVRPYFGQRRPESHQEFFDMDIIQKEFNCLHNEVFVLPKMYGTLDSDFYPNYTILNNYRKCLDFSKVQYMHFTHQGKPWTHRSDWSKNQYQLGTHPNASRMFTTWFREAHATCPSLIASI